MAKITKEWIVIGNYDGSILAEMAKGILTENDIPCYIKGDFFSTAYNINALSMPGGSVKLYIPKAFKTKAEDLIKEQEEQRLLDEERAKLLREKEEDFFL